MYKSPKSVFSSASMLLILNVLASGLNYLYQVMASKEFGVADFGVINAVFSFITVVGVPGSMLTMVISREIAICRASAQNDCIKYLIRCMTIVACVLSACTGVLLVLFHDYVYGFLSLQNSTQYFLLVLICMLVLFHPLYSGCMGGYQNFLILGLYALMIPGYKIVGLFVAELCVANMHVEISLVAILCGSLLTLVVGDVYVRVKSRKYKCKRYNRINIKELWDTFAINLGLMLYLNADILAVRRYGGDDVTGLYSAASLFGRMTYYVAASVGTVLIPKVAGVKKDSTKNLFKISFGLVIIIALMFGLCINILGKRIVLMVYGNEYSGAELFLPYVVLISVAMAGMAVVANYVVGIGKTGIISRIMVIMMVMIIVIVEIHIPEEIKLLLIGMIGVFFSIVYGGVALKGE